MVTAAQKKATAKFEAANYDKVLVRFPKGTKEEIKEVYNDSVNGFIVNAVLNEIEKEKRRKRLEEMPDPLLIRTT